MRTLAAAAMLFVAAVVSARPPDEVSILRDRWGVPHIFTSGPGASERSAYANGYAQAEDRLFEMDILRRAGTGRLAETLGPSYLLMDEVVRRDGYTSAELHKLFARLSARERRSLEAYRDGVNKFIAEVTAAPQRLPLEFGGVAPAPWTVEDSVAAAVLELLVEGANGGQEVLQADLLLDLLGRFPEPAARGIFDDLLWIDEPAAATTIAAADAAPLRANRDRVERFASAQLDLLRSHAPAIRRAAASLRQEQGLMGGLGAYPPFPLGLHRHASNAIVVSPELSATGHPILLGGPQTGLDAPSFFWEVGVHDPSYDAEGVIAPAGPGVLIGRGPNFAVTLTSGIDDAVDTYVERLDPQDPVEDAVATLPPGPENDPLREAVRLVRAWLDAGASLAAVPDGHGVVPFPGAAIYTAFRTAAQVAVFGDELGSALRTMYFPDVLVGDQEDDHGSFGTPDALFLRVLLAAGPVAGEPPASGVLPVSRDYFADVVTGVSQTRAGVLTDALRSALASLRARFGTDDQSQWHLPALRETYRDLGLISTIFGPTEMERENRGSFNMAIDLGSPVQGEIITPPGEAGSFTAADAAHEPPHLRDQLPVYEAFEYRRQPFVPADLEPPVTTATVAIVRAAR